MTIGYLISISILLIGIITGLGIYFCSVLMDNALLKKRERELQQSFLRAKERYNID